MGPGGPKNTRDEPCALANASKTTGEGLNPLWLRQNASKTGGEGIEPSPFASNLVKKRRGGVVPSPFVKLVSKNKNKKRYAVHLCARIHAHPHVLALPPSLPPHVLVFLCIIGW